MVNQRLYQQRERLLRSKVGSGAKSSLVTRLTILLMRPDNTTVDFAGIGLAHDDKELPAGDAKPPAQ